MRIMLCEDIRGLGWLGDVVEVNAGYARNYLLPQGLGKPATDANLRSIAKEKASRAEERKIEAEKLKVVAEAVEGAEAVVAGARHRCDAVDQRPGRHPRVHDGALRDGCSLPRVGRVGRDLLG